MENAGALQVSQYDNKISTVCPTATALMAAHKMRRDRRKPALVMYSVAENKVYEECRLDSIVTLISVPPTVPLRCLTGAAQPPQHVYLGRARLSVCWEARQLQPQCGAGDASHMLAVALVLSSQSASSVLRLELLKHACQLCAGAQCVQAALLLP
jgi:hypothetical protein